MKIAVSTTPKDSFASQKPLGQPLKREPNLFFDLAGDQPWWLGLLKITKAYPKGSLILVEGQPASGVYMLCQGRVKLSTCSPDGKIIILGVVEAGDVLGLSAVLTDVEYEASVEALEICQVNFVAKDVFVKYLEQNPGAGLSAARQLSRRYNSAHKMICSFGHSDSVLVKLAKLFLSWSAYGQGVDGSLRLKNSFTHEEIGEMIGTTRETVTRVLREMRERGLVTLKGQDLVIHSQDRLRDTSGLRKGDGQKI